MGIVNTNSLRTPAAMRLASFTDCGLRMLMHMALASDRAFLTEDLAEEFGLSRNHLAKIMQRLARAGLIETHRGGGAARWSGHRRRSPGRGRHDAAHLGPQLVQCRLRDPLFLRQVSNGHGVRRQHPLQHSGLAFR